MLTGTIYVRHGDTVYHAQGDIQNGTFQGRWHFSFGDYYDPDFVHFGTLRVFNDDTLSPGAIWPLHPHREIEVVTYCAAGEFRHADEYGEGGVLRMGDVQHTTVGRGMSHSEINNLPDKPMRFIQMWFIPNRPGLEPSVQQRHVKRSDRTNDLLPLVSNVHPQALPLQSDARVYASFMTAGASIHRQLEASRGVYLYVVQGGPILVNGHEVPELASAIIRDSSIALQSRADTELLLVDVFIG